MDFRNKLVFVLGKAFQSSLMFAGKTRAYPRVEYLKGSSLGRLERLSKDKHSNLLQKSINYSCKKFYVTSPWANKLESLCCIFFSLAQYLRVKLGTYFRYSILTEGLLANGNCTTIIRGFFSIMHRPQD